MKHDCTGNIIALLFVCAFACMPRHAKGLIDVVGYYGNSGGAVSSIPLLSGVDENYNVLILTFARINANGTFDGFDIQGPYENNNEALKADVAAWKDSKDKFGRKRLVLASIGGQNGRWPVGLNASSLTRGVISFLREYGLDGLDLDLEGPLVHEATTLTNVVRALVSENLVVTAAPEAAQSSLIPYEALCPLLTWVQPQFYNNGPNAVTTPFLPNATRWPTPWTVSDWQAESDGESFWNGVLQAIGTVNNLTTTRSQLGMLVPASPDAASQYNHWDIGLLAKQVKSSGITRVGTWAIAYDRKNEWAFAKAMGALNDAI